MGIAIMYIDHHYLCDHKQVDVFIDLCMVGLGLLWI